MIKDEQMHVTVSGSSVYNAVKNYLNNNEKLQAEITATVQKLIEDGTVANNVSRLLKAEIASYVFRHTFDRAVKEVLNEQVKFQMKQLVEEQVKKSLQNFIVLAPK